MTAIISPIQPIACSSNAPPPQFRCTAMYQKDLPPGAVQVSDGFVGKHYEQGEGQIAKVAAAFTMGSSGSLLTLINTKGFVLLFFFLLISVM